MTKAGATYLSRAIRNAESNLVCLRKPPHADVFARIGEVIQVLDRLIQADSLANFLEVKRGFNFQGDRDEETGATETTEGGHEEVRIHSPGTSGECSVCQEQTEREHMGRNHPIADTGSVGRSGYYSRECLVGYRTEVGHSEAFSAQSDVKFVESDAGLDDDKTFVPVDLFEEEKDQKGRKGGNGRLAVVPE